MIGGWLLLAWHDDYFRDLFEAAALSAAESAQSDLEEEGL